MESSLQLKEKRRFILIPFLYEFFGASILTYAYNFGVKDNLTDKDPIPDQQRSMARAAAFFMVWLMANSVSGAHFNPASSLVVFLYQKQYRKHIVLFIGFVLFQIAGCFFGIFITYLCTKYYGPPTMYPNANIGIIDLSSTDSIYFTYTYDIETGRQTHLKYARTIGQEILQTFIFTLILLIVKYRSSFQKYDDISKGIILSITLFCVYEMGLRSGECLNPALGIAQSAFMYIYFDNAGKSSPDGQAWWIYTFFPFVGALLGLGVYLIMQKCEIKQNTDMKEEFNHLLKK